jgi:hypothetical protein
VSESLGNQKPFKVPSFFYFVVEEMDSVQSDKMRFLAGPLSLVLIHAPRARHLAQS